MTRKHAHALSIRQPIARRTYANAMNFCTIFTGEMDGLYSLALLLTADGELAEECFLAALEDCRITPEVFHEKASAWSRRAIIKRAIQRMQPAVQRERRDLGHRADRLNEIPLRLLQLDDFERFVFTMTVLERYTAWECATLLDCRVQDVERAQIAALKFVGAPSENSAPALGHVGEMAAQRAHLGVPA